MLGDANPLLVNNAAINMPQESGVLPFLALEDLPAHSAEVIDLPIVEVFNKSENLATRMMESAQGVAEKITRISSWKRFSSMFGERFWTLLRNLSPVLVVFCK